MCISQRVVGEKWRCTLVCIRRSIEEDDRRGDAGRGEREEGEGDRRGNKLMDECGRDDDIRKNDIRKRERERERERWRVG